MKTKPESNRTLAYEFLRDEILPDQAYHGLFVTEEEVAQRVGVSRTPVREAFLLLGSEGLIQLIPRYGALIPPVTRQEVHEVLDFRRILELDTLSALFSGGNLPVERMQSLLEAQVAAMPSGNAREFLQLDTDFHLALVSARGNSLITKAYSDLRARHVRIGMSALVGTRERQAQVIAEHGMIVETMRSGDREAALAALAHHLTSTENSLNGIH